MAWRILGGIGRSMITVGALILLFVAYQLWGTGLQEARAQKSLTSQYDEILAEADQARAASPTSTSTTTSTVPGTTAAPGGQVQVVPTQVAPALPLPAYGEPVGIIKIPRIAVTRHLVEGIDKEQLKRGPGHYPESPLPGQKGNVAIAGHRTTYGQPFHNVDKLAAGDQVILTTVQGTFVYEVDGLEIVDPKDVSVLDDKGDNRLTLIACHPKYSLAQRIIVHATLKGKPAPEIAGQAKVREEARTETKDPFARAESLDTGVSARPVSKTPAIAWGLMCVLIWLISWLVQTMIRLRTRTRTEGNPTRAQRLASWSPYVVGLPLFLVSLYVFFENFSVLLPGNY